MNEIIELAKTIPDGTITETKPYPISEKVPQEILNELGIYLKEENNYVLVLEIQFDTEKIILQEYDDSGENLDLFVYNSLDLPSIFIEWLKASM